MAEAIKRNLTLNILFWIVASIAAFNLAYSYTLGQEVGSLQARTRLLEQKVQAYQSYLGTASDTFTIKIIDETASAAPVTVSPDTLPAVIQTE